MSRITCHSSHRRSSSVLTVVTFALLVATLTNAAFPPTSITAPYRQTKSIHFMNIDAGASSMTGSLAMQPATFGQHFPITSTVAGLPSFSAELVLPNSADDFLACRDPTLIPHDDFNQTFTGKIMMIRRGSCAFGLKGKRAELAGAAGLIIYGCPVTAPTLCAPGLQQPTVAVTQVGIPVTYIQTADGEALVAYIKARNAAITAGSSTIPAPAIMQVASTGALVASELAALKTIAATTTMQQDTVTSSYGNLRPWNIVNMNNASADPCLDRLAGIWCENGHIVEIYIAAMKWSSSISDGSIPPEIGSLTNLRYLSLQSNLFKGAVPPTFCQLTKLQELYLQLQVTGNYDGLTSLPSCLNALVSLNSILVNNNQLDSFPDLNASPNLALVDISNNHIPALPASFSTWTNLNSFAGSNNKISVLPSLASLTKLTSFKMSGNLLTDTILSTSFDNLVTLTTLDLSNNQLSGVLPAMKGCTQLTSLVLSNNKLSSPIPSVWPANIPNLLVFKAAHNQIISPVVVLTSLLLLQTADLSYNNITSYTGDPTQTGDAGAMLSGMTGPSVVTMNVAHNNITGLFGNNWFQLAKQLKTLDISYNQIVQLPTDIFTLTITSLDASNNAITTWGATTTVPSASFIYLSIINNPGLVAASLPTWMRTDVQMVTNPGSVFQCPRIYNPDNTFMTIQVDAQFTSYKGCQCVAGRFGAPPLCYPVPQMSTLLQDGSFSANSIGSNFPAVVQANSNRTEPGQNATMIDRSFSDAWYGNQRLTLGISTSFVVDLRSNISDPIRFITLHIHINTALFEDENDLISIYQGPSLTTSPRVYVAQGDEPLPDSSETGLIPGYTNTTAYRALYGAKIAAMGSSVALWEVVVLGPVATVSFNSRDTQGQHFFITYSYSYTCEDLGIGYFYDDEQVKCRAPLDIYAVDSGIRGAVFALSALAFVFVLIVSVLVITHFDTPVIRASSRPFLLLILLFLGMMSLGSLLYAAVPDETSLGKAVCNGRVWLAAFPLTGILAILLAKTNRISNIFTSTKFTVRKVKDQELGMIVLAMLGVVSVMLAIYSGVPLNSPRVAEGSGSTYAGRLIASCHNASGFAPWIAILLIYIFVLMIAAAVLAFKARDVPSKYNESTHIMNALFLLIFFGALIVPLDIFIQDSPDASVLIQGIGQSLLVMTLTAIIFLPKLYLLFSNQLPQAGETNTTMSSGHTPGGGSSNKLKAAGLTSGAGNTNGSSQPRGGSATNSSGTNTIAGPASPSAAIASQRNAKTLNAQPHSRGPPHPKSSSSHAHASSSSSAAQQPQLDTTQLTPEALAEYQRYQQNAKEFAEFVKKQKTMMQQQQGAAQAQPSSSGASSPERSSSPGAGATNPAARSLVAQPRRASQEMELTTVNSGHGPVPSNTAPISAHDVALDDVGVSPVPSPSPRNAESSQAASEVQE